MAYLGNRPMPFGVATRVRQDVPDAVHQMRVAIRRMRSALQAYGGIVDRAATRKLTDELRWLAGVLGEARDLEVLHVRFTHAWTSCPTSRSSDRSKHD